MNDDEKPSAVIVPEAELIKLRNEKARAKIMKMFDTHKPINCTVDEIIAVLQTDERLQGVFHFDRFLLNYVVNKPIPSSSPLFPEAKGSYPRIMEIPDHARLYCYVESTYHFKLTDKAFNRALEAIRSVQSKHCVTDWLDGLEWDKKPRLNQWLTQVFGCDLDDYHSAVGSKFLIAAVRRVKHPGCKFDNIIVFEGPQGIGKSTSLSMLFTQPWFTDHISAIGSKDAAIDMRGKWCIELSEIDQIIRSEVETVKAFLSCSVDHYRAPYDRVSADYPRQSVFAGTTNSDDYLRDPSGNRRVWPVRCNSADSIDREWLETNREQLWAEAVVREAANEPIWLDDELIIEQAKSHQKDRLHEDNWERAIHEHVNELTEVNIPNILSIAMSIPIGQQTKRDANRCGAVLRKLGWMCTSKRLPGSKKKFRVWIIDPNEAEK